MNQDLRKRDRWIVLCRHCVCVRERERVEVHYMGWTKFTKEQVWWCAVFLNTWSITCLVCLLFSIHQNPQTSLPQRHEGSIRVRYLYDSILFCNTSLVFGGCHFTSNSLCLPQTCFDVSLNNFSNFSVFHVQNLWLEHTNQTWLCCPATLKNEREEARCKCWWWKCMWAWTWAARACCC
jgi:hypothetical protein